MLGERPPPARSLSSAGLRRGASSTDVATLSGALALEFTCRGPGPYRALWRLAIWLCKCLQPGRRFSWSSLEDGTALLQPGRRFCWSSLKDATAPLEPGRRFCWSSLKDATAPLEPDAFADPPWRTLLPCLSLEGAFADPPWRTLLPLFTPNSHAHHTTQITGISDALPLVGAGGIIFVIIYIEYMGHLTSLVGV